MYRPKEFYQDLVRRQKWSNSVKLTSLCGTIEFSKRQKTLESLVLCKYTRSRLLDDLTKRPLHEILKELKQIGVVFPKKAAKILLESIPKHLVFQNKIYEFDIFSRKFDDFYIEYNGIIHYKPIYSQQKFEEIRKKDLFKKEIAFLMGKRFIVIKDIWPFDKQVEIVRTFLSS